jgi:hypothetical protein
MSIAGLGTLQTAHPIITSAAAASSAQGGFGAQVQAWMASQSSASSGATQSASLTEPGRATPGAARHHHAQSPSTDANTADGTSNNPSGPASSASLGKTANTGAGATSSTGQQTPGGLLLNDMMRGLQAYGATSSIA